MDALHIVKALNLKMENYKPTNRDRGREYRTCVCNKNTTINKF